MSATALKKGKECSLCFDVLGGSETVVALRNEACHECHHYVHERCADWLLRDQGDCPVCQRPYTRVVAMPKFEEDRRAWFAAIDRNGDGYVSREEAMSALAATGFDGRGLDDLMTGHLTFEDMEEFLHSLEPVPEGQVLPPLLSSDRSGWFRFWDEDGSGTLEKREIYRALVKTFDLSRDYDAIRTLKETLNTIWNIFDCNKDGALSFDEFVATDGFGETLSASLTHLRQRTNLLPPVQQQQQQPLPLGSDGLPPGWDIMFTAFGKPYYVNHNSRTTQWHHPAAMGGEITGINTDH